MNKNKWKFLLIGITGDLSKRKILPALSEFSNLNNDSVEVELFGYSRSKPEEKEIQEILGENSAISKVEYVQGEYSDPSFFQKLTENLKPEERLIVYFAVPPMIFLELLATFCPYYKANLDIIIEKPFGRDYSEAVKILDKIHECKLENNVHFCDHYLFKDAAKLDLQTKGKVQEFVKDKKINHIEIKALEALGVRGRGGYYDDIGAIKDMLPAHLFSLYELVFAEIFDQISTDDISIEYVELGQYEGYLSDIERETSNTETYFKIKTKINNNIDLTFESGKKLGKKLTEVNISFTDGTTLAWNIDPLKEIRFDSKVFDLRKHKNLDHTNMFEAILNKDSTRFFKNKNTLAGWKLYDKIKFFIAENPTDLTFY